MAVGERRDGAVKIGAIADNAFVLDELHDAPSRVAVRILGADRGGGHGPDHPGRDGARLSVD